MKKLNNGFIRQMTAIVEDKDTGELLKIKSFTEPAYKAKEFKRDLEQSYIIHVFHIEQTIFQMEDYYDASGKELERDNESLDSDLVRDAMAFRVNLTPEMERTRTLFKGLIEIYCIKLGVKLSDKAKESVQRRIESKFSFILN